MGTDALGRDVFSRTHLRRAHLARGRLPRDRPDRDHRRDAGHDRGLLPRLGRHRAVALDGRRARVPGAAARARPRRGLLAEGLPDRPSAVGRDLVIVARRHPAHPGHRRGHIAGCAGAAGFSGRHAAATGCCACAGRRSCSWPPSIFSFVLVVERDADPARACPSSSSSSRSPAGPTWRASSAARCSRCARRSSSRPPARWAPPTRASSSATSCRTSWRRSSSTRRC